MKSSFQHTRLILALIKVRLRLNFCFLCGHAASRKQKSKNDNNIISSIVELCWARKNIYKYPYSTEDVHISKSDLHVYLHDNVGDKGRARAHDILEL